MNTEDTTKDKYIIDTKSVQNSFEQELRQYDSSARIFFSGKYGVGKTKFLERFFAEKKEEYLTVHLYPVNYQIYNNLDIIELLKADIIIELLKQNILFADNSKLTLVEYWKQYATPSLIAEKIVDYGTDISNTISSAIPENPLYSIPIGVFSILGRALKDYQAVNSHFQDIQSGDNGIIEKFLRDSKEPDIISSIVHTTIKDINDKKSVLIIDDLDRLDPEHIFRILNILSAHFDQDGDNKFGFDYIIIVGDYHNIQSIFHHKYGKDADFDGYIDKFYTVKPFEFDNRKALLVDLGRLLGEYKRTDYVSNPNKLTFGIIDDILRKSIDSDSINLRALLKNQKYKLLSLSDKKENIPSPEFEGNRLRINRAIDILIDVFGTKEKLIDIIQKIKSSQLYTDFILHYDKAYQYIIKDIYDSVDRIIIGQKPADRYTFKSSFSQAEYIVQFPENSYGVPEVSILESMGDITYRNLYYDILSEYINQDKHLN